MENITPSYFKNSSLFEAEGDFFQEMYSDSILKQLTMVLFVTGASLGLALEFGIIWYERNGDHRYRTVINQLFSTISWLVVGYILFVYIPYGIRYSTGPLNVTYCSFQNFMDNFLTACVVLTVDCIVLLRYVFIFKLTNFAVINDDFIATFLQMTILLVSLSVTTVKRMSVGRMPLNYFMCLGINPDQDTNGSSEQIIKKLDTTGIIVIISFVANIFAFVKIFLYQRKIEKATKVELGQINQLGNNGSCQRNVAWESENQPRGSGLPKSMADLTTQILCLIFQVTFVVVNVTMNGINPEDLNRYENRWLAYYIQIIGVSVAIVGISIQYYIKNSSLPKAIWRNWKEQLNCVTVKCNQ